jgi:hypothetical protein
MSEFSRSNSYEPPITATVSTVAPTGAVLDVTFAAEVTKWTRERRIVGVNSNMLDIDIA